MRDILEILQDYEERKGINLIKIELKYYNGTPVIKK